MCDVMCGEQMLFRELSLFFFSYYLLNSHRHHAHVANPVGGGLCDAVPHMVIKEISSQQHL